jgi:hypothetical protein
MLFPDASLVSPAYFTDFYGGILSKVHPAMRIERASGWGRIRWKDPLRAGSGGKNSGPLWNLLARHFQKIDEKRGSRY